MTARRSVWCARMRGDDPDITNGVLISSAVRRADSGIVIDGGSGVGRVTRPGLAEPVGEAAINPGPRAQIKRRSGVRHRKMAMKADFRL